MGQWLWGFMCLYNRGTHFQKNQKQQNGRDYIHKSYEKPFCEKKKKRYKIIQNTLTETTKTSTM